MKDPFLDLFLTIEKRKSSKDRKSYTAKLLKEGEKKIEDLGAGEILLTSMDKDGTKSGFDLEILHRANEY